MTKKDNHNKKTICLNMIVKNEAHVITETFDNLFKYISFDYWIISDTGSTDGTQQVIKDYFKLKNIDGKIYQDEWRDFGHNRTLALQYAKGVTDYLLIFDADDSIHGDFMLPEYSSFNHDMYNLKMGLGVSYVRPLLINNNLEWVFHGVLHEYLSCKTINIEGKLLEGNYYVESGRKGSRSSDPDKYKKDAEVLKNAYYVELNKPNKGLSGRYAFYCAQSYKDINMNKESIEWYTIVVDKTDSWAQEKFISCISLGELYNREHDFENSIKYYMRSITYDHERIDGIAFACEILLNKGLHLLCCLLGEKYLGYNKTPIGKLFLFDFCYYNHIEYSCSIAAFYCGQHELGYKCCKTIIMTKHIENTYKLIKACSNLIFYKKQLIIDTDDDDNMLLFFYSYNDIIQNLMISNDNIEPGIHECWNILFEKNRSKLTKPPLHDTIVTMNSNLIYAKSKNKTNAGNTNVFISFTTCKRYDLFKETIHSIMNHWLDKDKIDYWFCVDDNSDIKDRKQMKKNFPWINYYMKTEMEKGHRESMNIIWNKLKELKPKYWIHMEDDFLFYTKRNYVEDSIKVLEKYYPNNIRQVLFNRNYAETIEHTNTKGHVSLSNDMVIPYIPVVFHNYNTASDLKFQNCCYWPDYSFRPSMIDVETILNLGDYNTENQFFEMDYAKRWHDAGHRSAFFSSITCRHIGRLTSERSDKTKPNAYELNNTSQFNHSSSSSSFGANSDSDNSSNFDMNISISVRKLYSPPIKVAKDSFIKIVNLKHREDRKRVTTELLTNAGFSDNDYEFVEAVYGKELKPSLELFKMFEGNDFGSRSGFIGCALSHYGLWMELLQDTKNEFYFIMEDDFTLCNSFKYHYTNLKTSSKITEKDVIFFGYHMYETNKNKYKDIYFDNDITESTNVKLELLNKEIYIGATHSYTINKNGAKKLIDYIHTNGIKHGIDYVMKIHNTLDSWELQPHLSHAVWNETSLNYDTDIQSSMESIDFNSFADSVYSNNFIFIKGYDQMNYDIYHKPSSLNDMMIRAISDPKCMAFNTLGFYKSEIHKLTPSQWFKQEDGIYIKKTHLHKLREQTLPGHEHEHQHENVIVYGEGEKGEKGEKEKKNKKQNITNIKRVKMLCNWCSSYDLCKEWCNMCSDPDNYIWNNSIEITWENTNIDYYVIVNMPPENEYYDPQRTIIFQMEPWVNDNSKKWGVKTWGKWANPNPSKDLFLKVFGRKTNDYNNVFWQLELNYNQLVNLTYDIKDKCDEVSSICSSKYFDEGHIHRIDFLKFIEEKIENQGSIKLNIFNSDNKFNFKNYKGVVSPYVDKSKGILPYKYYFMVENNYEDDFITEKIWEPILCESLCFYYGCPNIDNYVDMDAFVLLDMNDFEKSYAIIKKAIEEDWWSKRIESIRAQKDKFLKKMGFFPRLESFINTL